MCGGFIWDFVDQALHRKAQDGTDLWLYGTDFEKEEPRHWYSLPNTTAITGSNTYFCANGIIGADRTVHPQYYEVQKVYAPVQTLAVNPDSGSFTVKNKMLFTNINALECRWQIEVGGRLLMHGKLEPIDCPPLSEVTVSLPYTMDQDWQRALPLLGTNLCCGLCLSLWRRKMAAICTTTTGVTG